MRPRGARQCGDRRNLGWLTFKSRSLLDPRVSIMRITRFSISGFCCKNKIAGDKFSMSAKVNDASFDYRAIVENLPGLYLILDAGLTLVGVSNAYDRATLTRREEIIGRGLFDVFPDNPDDPTADGVRNLRASLQRVLNSGNPDTMAVQKFDVRKPEQEGGGLEERYWTVINSPVLGEDGRIRYIIHKAEDVTEFIRLKQTGLEQSRCNEHLSEQAARMEAEIFERSREVAAASALLKN